MKNWLKRVFNSMTESDDWIMIIELILVLMNVVLMLKNVDTDTEIESLARCGFIFLIMIFFNIMRTHNDVVRTDAKLDYLIRLCEKIKKDGEEE